MVAAETSGAGSWADAAAAVAAAVDVLVQESATDLADVQLPVALQHAAVQASRLQAVAAGVVAEADTRRVWRAQGASSIRGWVRRCVQLADDATRLVTAARMRAFTPKMAALFSAGQVSLAQMGTAARQVQRLPDGPDWPGHGCDPDALHRAGDDCVGDDWSGDSGQAPDPATGDFVPPMWGDLRSAADDILAERASWADARMLAAFGEQIHAAADPGGHLGEELSRRERRHLSISKSFEGMGEVAGRLDPQAADRAITVLNALSHPAGPADDRTAAQRRADAFDTLCTSWLHGGDVPPAKAARPAPEGSPAAGDPPARDGGPAGEPSTAPEPSAAPEASAAPEGSPAAGDPPAHGASPAGEASAAPEGSPAPGDSPAHGASPAGEDSTAAQDSPAAEGGQAEDSPPAQDSPAREESASPLDSPGPDPVVPDGPALAGGPGALAGRAHRDRMIVTIPYRTLLGLAGAPAAVLGDGTPVSALAARRLACDAVIRRVVTAGPGDLFGCRCGHICASAPLDGGGPGRDDPGERAGPGSYDPTAKLARVLRAAIAALPPPLGTRPAILDAGRATPTFTQPIRDALHAQYGGRCSFPGCDQPATIDHHLIHWADGGPTSAANGAPLCAYHHYLVHEGGWHLGKDAVGKITAAAPPPSWPGPRTHWRKGRPHTGPPPGHLGLGGGGSPADRAPPGGPPPGHHPPRGGRAS